MNIEDIEKLNLCCPYCKTTLYWMNGYAEFLLQCKNMQCKKYQSFLIEGSSKRECIFYCTFYFNDEKQRIFCCDDKNYFIEYYKTSIKLTNEKFLDMLRIYAKRFDLKDIEEKYDTLMLFK